LWSNNLLLGLFNDFLSEEIPGLSSNSLKAQRDSMLTAAGRGQGLYSRYSRYEAQSDCARSCVMVFV
jgi:hypothetical protein